MSEMRRMLSFVRRAVEDYDMIEEGDRIAVGVSGGKDSLVLLETHSVLRLQGDCFVCNTSAIPHD